MLDIEKLKPHVETLLPLHKLAEAKQKIAELKESEEEKKKPPKGDKIRGEVLFIETPLGESNDRSALYKLEIFFEHEEDLEAFRKKCADLPKIGRRACVRGISERDSFLFQTFFPDVKDRFLCNDFQKALDEADGDSWIVQENNRRITEFTATMSELTDTGDIGDNGKATLDDMHAEYDAFKEKVAREFGERRRQARHEPVAKVA